MGYPVKLLSEDEQVVMDLHPHWKALVAPVVVLIAVLAAGSYLAAAMPNGSWQGWGRLAVLVVGLALLAAFAIRPFLRWFTTHFVITNRRVLMRSGVFARTGRDIPLSRINDITFSHTFFERLLGCGTLVVESAGERGQVTLTDIPQVERVQRELYDLVESTEARLRNLPPALPDA